MALSDIAEGLATTQQQEDRGVAVVDRTDRSLSSVVEPFAEELPCDAEAAADLVSAYTSGASVGDASLEAGVPPVTASKALYLLGFEGLNPLPPVAREVCRDWLAADLSRTDALALSGASEAEFALAAYIETHEPIEGAGEQIRDALSTSADAMVEKRDALSDTMTAARDLQ